MEGGEEGQAGDDRKDFRRVFKFFWKFSMLGGGSEGSQDFGGSFFRTGERRKG